MELHIPPVPSLEVLREAMCHRARLRAAVFTNRASSALRWTVARTHMRSIAHARSLLGVFTLQGHAMLATTPLHLT
jgi:hypothetical protein